MKTHPLKELEILLNAGVSHLDNLVDGGTDDACDCLREGADILNHYLAELRFDDSGNAPAELQEAENKIKARTLTMEELQKRVEELTKIASATAEVMANACTFLCNTGKIELGTEHSAALITAWSNLVLKV